MISNAMQVTIRQLPRTLASTAQDNGIQPFLQGADGTGGAPSRHPQTGPDHAGAQPPEGDQRLAVGIGYARPYLRFLDQRYGAVMGLQSAGIEPLAWPRRRRHGWPVLRKTPCRCLHPVWIRCCLFTGLKSRLILRRYCRNAGAC